MTRLVLATLLCAACTPVRMGGDVAVGTGQIALGAADMVF